ncbi:MAG TPA: ATP-grasp domain-containing protein [Candidatus Saccharimonadales bacterium]
MKTVLIVGKAFAGLTGYLKTHGVDYVVLKDSLRAPQKPKKRDDRVFCDFSNPDAMLRTVDELTAARQIDGVMVTYEQYVVAAARIAHHIHLPGLPVNAAMACTDKSIMRELFASAPKKISPDFAIATDEETVREFAAEHTFPLILKPANLSKSLLVSKCNSLEALIETYTRTRERMAAVYAKYAPHTTPKLIVEEFMEGSVHSVDAFVDKDGTPHVLDAVVDYQTGYDVGYDDNFHYSRLLPSALMPHQIEAIRHTADLGCRALRMKNTPAHVEIILTKDGPRIVEIGARNGGYRERMHTLANGIDITGNALKLAFGDQPDNTSKKHDSVGVFELFPKEPGAFIDILSESALRELPSFNYLSIKAKPGEFAGKSSDGFKMCAVVILHHADAAQFTADRTFLDTQVSVRTQPTS